MHPFVDMPLSIREATVIPNVVTCTVSRAFPDLNYTSDDAREFLCRSILNVKDFFNYCVFIYLIVGVLLMLVL